MSHRIFFALALVAITASTTYAGEKRDPGRPEWRPPFEVDEPTRRVLDEINGLSPYQLPNLPLREDDRYAHTSSAISPFRHVEPFKRHFLLQMEYAGPGRTMAEPDDVKTVKIGLLAPLYPTVSAATGGRSHEENLGRPMHNGCLLAIEEANAYGGYLKRRIPFELVSANDNGLWGSSGEEIIKLAYRQKVWAILGSIDGANSHIAIRVGLKIEIPMMNSGDTDPTFIETNIPWVMRCIGDDRQQGYLLADYLYHKRNYQRVGLIRASNRYGRFGLREIRDMSRRLGRPVPVEMAYAVGIDNFSLQLDRLESVNVEAVVHWGDAREGALILNQMRNRGMQQAYFASDRCLLTEFTDIAGKNAEGVVCGSPWHPGRQDPNLEAFRAAYRKRFNEEAETYACHAYDGMNMLIWAIQLAGLNRAKIRDVLAYRQKPWPGITGEIPFSGCLDDAGEVFLAERKNGKWHYSSRQQLGLPPLAGHVASSIGKTNNPATN